jgi:hypothetical protein
MDAAGITSGRPVRQDTIKTFHTYQSNMKLRYSLVLVAGLTLASVGCNKRDQNVETNYNAEKASAETLISTINTDMTQMKTDHQQWTTTLAEAAKKPGADTSKINSILNRMKQHETDANNVMVLVDSVKQYMNVTSDNNDQLKAANDRLTSNVNDLQSKWKSLQDDHASLKTDVESFAVNAAGDAVKDTAKANSAAKTAPATTPAKNPHETAKHSTGGVPKSTGTSTSSSTSTGDNGGAAAHETKKHSTGGVEKSTGK